MRVYCVSLTLAHTRAIIGGSGPKFLTLGMNFEERMIRSVSLTTGIGLRFPFHGRGLKCGCRSEVTLLSLNTMPYVNL